MFMFLFGALVFGAGALLGAAITMTVKDEKDN